MPNFKGAELDMVLTGIYSKEKIKDYNIKEGDKLIGIASSGIHSNGLTGARSFAESLPPSEKESFYKELAVPTLIYNNAFNDLEGLSGAIHITGGAFTKIAKVLPKGLRAYIHRNHNLKPQRLFYQLREKATNQRMYNYFNCGIGMILIARKDKASEIAKKVNASGYKADIIGSIEKGKEEVRIESMFDNELVTL